MNKHQAEQHIKAQWESFHFARDKYYLWAGTVITLSSAILGFVASSLAKESSLIQNRLTAYYSLLFLTSAIVYGIQGLKKRIELEWNCSTGRLLRLSGDPLTKKQEAAIKKIECIHGKDDNFSDWLFRIFLVGLILLIAAVIPVGQFISTISSFFCQSYL